MAHTRAQIQAALGRELEEVFCVFDPEPCASGSVAQVHRAILRDSFLEERGLAGLPVREVAVKVVHPGVLDTTFVDLEILFRSFASINNVVVALGGPDIQIPFDRVEADRAMRHQLDLRWEARNLARFSQNFAEDDGVVFPEVVLAASGVLVESWLEGTPILFTIYSGQMERFERKANLKSFRNGEVSVLLTTDLGGRGLDIERVERVINIYLPRDIDNYLHRAGRTARAGREGLVINLVTQRDHPLMAKLKKRENRRK